MKMNAVSLFLVILAMVFMLLPIPLPALRAHSVCIKAHIDDRMFNYHTQLEGIPQKDNEIQIGDYVRRVDYVRWSGYGVLVFLVPEEGDQAEAVLLEAGFIEYKKKKTKK